MSYIGLKETKKGKKILKLKKKAAPIYKNEIQSALRNVQHSFNAKKKKKSGPS